MPECRLAVLGLSGRSAVDVEGEGRVGKSSLCCRFVSPREEAYRKFGEDHESVVSITDFHDSELNGDHFLYFGKARRDYLPTASAQPVPLVVHVVEQTEFVDDACYRQLGAEKPKSYPERATLAKLSSPGKVAYRCRSMIGDETEERGAFPAEFSMQGVDGYVFVLDPCTTSDLKSQQMTVLDQCLSRLPKGKPVALALTKCDSFSSLMQDQMNAEFDLVGFFLAGTKFEGGAKKRPLARSGIHSVPGKMELKRNKTSIPYFFTSSRDGVGVDAPFLHLAHTIFRLPGSPPKQACYSSLSEERTALGVKLSVAVRKLMRSTIADEQSLWREKQWCLREKTDFQKFEEVRGEAEAKDMFCARLVEIGLEKAYIEESARSADACQGPLLGNSGLTAENIVDNMILRKASVEHLLSTHPDLAVFSSSRARMRSSLTLYMVAPLALPSNQSAPGHMHYSQAVEESASDDDQQYSDAVYCEIDDWW